MFGNGFNIGKGKEERFKTDSHKAALLPSSAVAPSTGHEMQEKEWDCQREEWCGRDPTKRGK